MNRTAAFVLLLALVAGCQSDRPSIPEATESPALFAALPLPENAVDNAVAELDGLAEDLMESSGIPGMAVAVVHGGETVYAKGFGVKDATSGDGPANQVGPDTVFQVASVSKSLSASVVAQQVGVGTISWNTPVVSELPDFALSDPAVTAMVTVGDLFSHRSGLPDHAGDLLEDLGYDRRQILERLRQLPLDPFRISYAYTNFGLTVAAEAVAAAAGMPWDQLVDEVLVDGLEMSSTSARFADYRSRPDRALAHIRVDGGYEPRYERDADAQAPAGGVSSSVNDMTHWVAMVLANGTYDDRQVVDPAALLPALTPQVLSSPPSEPAARSGFYGFGFNVGTSSAARTELSHSGAFQIGAASVIRIIPSADVGIVVLTNATPAGIPETLAAQFADLVQTGEIREDWQALYGNAFEEMDAPVGSLVGKTPPAAPVPAAPLAQYVGTYENEYWGPARVSERDGGLALTLGPKAQPWPLTHWDGDVFSFSFVSENTPPGSVSTATFDGDELTLEYYDANGMGVFSR